MRRPTTIRVVAVDEVVAVVVHAVRAILLAATGKVPAAVRVCAVHEVVAVVVRMVRTLLRLWNALAGWVRRTIKIVAVDETVAVVVDAVRADFSWGLLAGSGQGEVAPGAFPAVHGDVVRLARTCREVQGFGRGTAVPTARDAGAGVTGVRHVPALNDVEVQVVAQVCEGHVDLGGDARSECIDHLRPRILIICTCVPNHVPRGVGAVVRIRRRVVARKLIGCRAGLGPACRTAGAIRIRTVDETVAVIIDSVAASFGLRHAATRIRSAVWILAVRHGITVVVDAVPADFRLSHAAVGRLGTIGIVAIHQAVAVVVDAVSAHLRSRHAAVGIRSTVGIVAIHQAVAVVVQSVPADFRLAVASADNLQIECDVLPRGAVHREAVRVVAKRIGHTDVLRILSRICRHGHAGASIADRRLVFSGSPCVQKIQVYVASVRHEAHFHEHRRRRNGAFVEKHDVFGSNFSGAAARIVRDDLGGSRSCRARLHALVAADDGGEITNLAAAVRGIDAIRVVAVYELVAVVVQAVVAVFGDAGACRIRRAIRIVAVRPSVVVVVDLVRAVRFPVLACRVGRTIGILTVDESIAVVVLPVRADFLSVAAFEIRTGGIVAVAVAVAVVIETVCADLGRPRVDVRVRVVAVIASATGRPVVVIVEVYCLVGTGPLCVTLVQGACVLVVAVGVGRAGLGSEVGPAAAALCNDDLGQGQS